MAMRISMMRLARWHIWLGWLAALPILIWIISGLVMVARPIEVVRGTDLRTDPMPIPQGMAVTTPQVSGSPIERMALVMRLDRPIWVIERADGAVMARDAARDEFLPAVDAALASSIANAALKAPAAIETVRRFAADANPIDLRRERPAWQVRYADGVNVYVDADSGEVLAVRTRWWRFFDFMWGLHIMDPMGREDTSHPWLWIFGGLALVSSLFGTVLLFRRRKAAK